MDVYKVLWGCPVTSKVFAGPITTLPTTIFYSIVVGVLYNSG